MYIKLAMESEEKNLDNYINKEISTHLTEINSLKARITKKGKKNKVILGFLLIFGIFFSAREIFGEVESVYLTIIFSLVILIPVIIITILISPYKLVSKERLNELNSSYINRVINTALRFISPGFSYRPNYKTNKQTLVRSKLFTKITEYKDGDAVTGEINQCKITLSKVYIMNNLKNTFNGFFIFLRFNELLNESKEEHIKKVIKLLKESYKDDINFSINGASLYISVNHKGRIFENNPAKYNDESIITQIRVVNELFSSIKEIVSKVANEEEN